MSSSDDNPIADFQRERAEVWMQSAAALRGAAGMLLDLVDRVAAGEKLEPEDIYLGREAARDALGIQPVDANVERFFAIRRTDGDLMFGEYGWTSCDGPNDWDAAEESDHDEPTEYEIVEMSARSLAKRTFCDTARLHVPDKGLCDYCEEPWPCEFMREYGEAVSG